MERQYDWWYIPDEDEEGELYASVSVASGSDASQGDIPLADGTGANFQIAVLFSLGVICGVLLVSRRLL